MLRHSHADRAQGSQARRSGVYPNPKSASTLCLPSLSLTHWNLVQSVDGTHATSPHPHAALTQPSSISPRPAEGMRGAPTESPQRSQSGKSMECSAPPSQAHGVVSSRSQTTAQSLCPTAAPSPHSTGPPRREGASQNRSRLSALAAIEAAKGEIGEQPRDDTEGGQRDQRLQRAAGEQRRRAVRQVVAILGEEGASEYRIAQRGETRAAVDDRICHKCWRSSGAQLKACQTR